jgi:hypothetical protein
MPSLNAKYEAPDESIILAQRELGLLWGADCHSKTARNVTCFAHHLNQSKM